MTRVRATAPPRVELEPRDLAEPNGTGDKNDAPTISCPCPLSRRQVIVVDTRTPRSERQSAPPHGVSPVACLAEDQKRPQRDSTLPYRRVHRLDPSSCPPPLETPTRELLAATTVTYTSQVPPPMRRTRRSERPGHAAHRHLTHARLLAPLSPFALLGSREGSLHASSPDHQSV